MILSKSQYNNLPDNYKQYFVEIGGGEKDEQITVRKNVHP